MHALPHRFIYAISLVVLLLAAAPAAGQFCGTPTNCRVNGHNTYNETDFPYTEDIVFGPTQPISDPLVLFGPTFAWTTIQTGCDAIGRFNLNGTQPFNALLRVQVGINSATAAPGARYEVQLIVDGQQRGWYVRRLRGVYPQLDVFAASVQGLSAGKHQFSVQARLLDSGSITLSNTYMTAQGSPTTYPSIQSVASGLITIQSVFYQPVTNTVTFTNSSAVDLAIQGYFQINSATQGQHILIAPFLDGTRYFPRGVVGIPPYLYDGANVLHVIRNVQPGTHTLDLRVVTNNYPVSFSNRAVEFVAFPASTPSVFLSDMSGTQTFVSTSTTEPQPGVFVDGCGNWTKLAESTIPVDPTAPWNQLYQGFIRFPGGVSGSRYGQLIFETIIGSAVTDGGGRIIEVPLSQDGAYIFGDTMHFADSINSETVRMWARKVNPCGGSPGSFFVSDRYFWVKHIPITPRPQSCFYD
jgi:hypothetical protein